MCTPLIIDAVTFKNQVAFIIENLFVWFSSYQASYVRLH